MTLLFKGRKETVPKAIIYNYLTTYVSQFVQVLVNANDP